MMRKLLASPEKIVIAERGLLPLTRMLCALFILVAILRGMDGEGSSCPQQEEQFHWSTPVQIPNYYDLLRAPLLVADQNHKVHAFDIKQDDLQNFTILYRQWDMNQGWSLPVDIIIPAYGGSAPSLRGVALDERGYFHLIYFGGDLAGGNIFYSSAHISSVANARGWSDPIPITSYALLEAAASIIVTEDGGLIVLFAGERYGAGLYEVHSKDGGLSWSASELLSRSMKSGIYPGSVWMAKSENGRIHVVWHLADEQGLGVEIRYANYDFALASWEDETIIAVQEDELDLLGWPSLVDGEDQLILVYQDGFPPTRWVVYSDDAGKTWSPPIRPFPHRGGYGVAYLLRDSAGVVHLVLGNRLQNPEISGMWYSKYLNGQWIPLSPIISGPSAEDFGPCCPEAIISQGNVLLATWPHNVRTEFLSGAWYAYLRLESPELPVIKPPAVDSSAGQPREGSRLIPTAPPTPTAETGPITRRTDGGTPVFLNPVWAGLLPLGVGIALVILFRRWGDTQAKAKEKRAVQDQGAEERDKR